jgi:two-component system sensor histidine kinase/response regulator
MMGGRIWVDSKLGQGSQFHFTAQFIAVGEEQEATPSTTLIGTPILVVDDSQSNLKILDELLENWGLIPTCAGSAAQATQLAREACEEGRPFPMLLIDANMPDSDGFSLAESIHADPDLSCRIIMMLTSETHPRDLSRDRDLGITSCLLKPVKESELFHAVFGSLGIRRLDDATQTDQPRKSPTLPPLRILLVEDSLVNQKLAVGLLAKYGHHVVVANHGREAVEVFDAQPFDLVLMDIQMPEMDGFEATQVIRAKQNGRPHRTPIIAMTAHAMKGDRERCLQAGMDGYVAKPIRAAVLFHTITKVLDRALQS